MAVPDFQSLMIPVLRAVADGKTYTAAEVNNRVAKDLLLTEADLAELLPSGKNHVFYNRVNWAKYYLFRAGLVSQPRRALWEINQRGRDTLATDVGRITISDLKQYPEFREFVSHPKKSGGKSTLDEIHEDTGRDPVEMMETGYEQMRAELARTVLEQAKSCSPEFFEQLVVDLLVAMGYGGSRADAGHAVGGSGDGGIDGIIKEDRLGLDAVYIQAKRWEGSVSRPTVQGFTGSLEGQRARKGVLITTSRFTHDAREYVEKIEKKIVLIDGEQLAELMIDYGIGVAEVTSYSVKRLDTDYFESDSVQ
jgi:restriction system protein